MILVTGSGGFIAGYLVADLLKRGHRVCAVDLKPREEWHQWHPSARNWDLIDLRDSRHIQRITEGCHTIYNLAADMGGMGFIEHNKAACMRSVLINTNLIEAARQAGVSRYFYASSACVYAADKQRSPDNPALVETDAYPPAPEDGYGWEKLFSERMCRHYREDYGLETRVARYHNVYGPLGTWFGGREKAPAAICRKVAEAVLSGRHEIQIWGDGTQTRSFMHVDDCVRGTVELTASDHADPINLGSAERVTINRLVDLVEGIAGVKLYRHYILGAPKGVNGRSSDNTLWRSKFGWEPSIPLVTGLTQTYRWIYDQLASK